MALAQRLAIGGSGANNAVTVLITDAQVTVSNNIATINPANDFIGGKTYTVTMASGVLKDSENTTNKRGTVRFHICAMTHNR